MTRIIKARSVSIIFLDRFLNISAKNITSWNTLVSKETWQQASTDVVSSSISKRIAVPVKASKKGLRLKSFPLHFTTKRNPQVTPEI